MTRDHNGAMQEHEITFLYQIKVTNQVCEAADHVWCETADKREAVEQALLGASMFDDVVVRLVDVSNDTEVWSLTAPGFIALNDSPTDRALKLLAEGPMLPSELTRALGYEAAGLYGPMFVTHNILVELEMSGRVERMPDGRYCEKMQRRYVRVEKQPDMDRRPFTLDPEECEGETYEVRLRAYRSDISLNDCYETRVHVDLADDTRPVFSDPHDAYRYARSISEDTSKSELARLHEIWPETSMFDSVVVEIVATDYARGELVAESDWLVVSRFEKCCGSRTPSRVPGRRR